MAVFDNMRIPSSQPWPRTITNVPPFLSSGNAQVGLGPFGEFGVNGNLQVPGSTDGFLVNAIIALGVISLFQIAATVLTPLLFGAGSEEAEEGSERAYQTTLDGIKTMVMTGIQNHIQKYE